MVFIVAVSPPGLAGRHTAPAGGYGTKTVRHPVFVVPQCIPKVKPAVGAGCQRLLQAAPGSRFGFGRQAAIPQLMHDKGDKLCLAGAPHLWQLLRGHQARAAVYSACTHRGRYCSRTCTAAGFPQAEVLPCRSRCSYTICGVYAAESACWNTAALKAKSSSPLRQVSSKRRWPSRLVQYIAFQTNCGPLCCKNCR